MAKMPLQHFSLIYRQLVLIHPELKRLPAPDEIAPHSKMRMLAFQISVVKALSSKINLARSQP